jgi:hypothetical protein
MKNTTSQAAIVILPEPFQPVFLGFPLKLKKGKDYFCVYLCRLRTSTAATATMMTTATTAAM